MRGNTMTPDQPPRFAKWYVREFASRPQKKWMCNHEMCPVSSAIEREDYILAEHSRIIQEYRDDKTTLTRVIVCLIELDEQIRKSR
jgi:hypothetical protein